MKFNIIINLIMSILLLSLGLLHHNIFTFICGILALVFTIIEIVITVKLNHEK
jgi:uncharacterized membrane protein